MSRGWHETTRQYDSGNLGGGCLYAIWTLLKWGALVVAAIWALRIIFE